MGRWSQYDEDDYRLPEGMTRIGYDADTQTYTYRDASGKTYEGAPGNRYGVLRPVNEGPFLCGPRNNHTQHQSGGDGSLLYGPHKTSRRMSDFLDDSYYSGDDDKSNFRVCGECLITPFVYLYQVIASWVPRAAASDRSDEEGLLLDEEEPRTSSHTGRPQTTRDYLLNGANPKKALKWFNESRSQFQS